MEDKNGKELIKLSVDIISEYLYQDEIPHKITWIGSRKIIETEDVIYKIASPDMMSPFQLQFIKKVKKYVLDDKEGKMLYLSQREIPFFNNFYFDALFFKEGNFRDIYELDVKSAYWHVARKLGIITEKLFIEGFNHKKKVRLISLGALARESYTIDWHPKKGYSHKYNIEFSEMGVKLFKIIAYETNLHFSSMALHCNILFYWVDAAFCERNSLEKVYFYLKNSGLRFRIKEIVSANIVKIKNGQMIANVKNIKSVDRNDMGKGLQTNYKERPFHLSSEKSKLQKHKKKYIHDKRKL